MKFKQSVIISIMSKKVNINLDSDYLEFQKLRKEKKSGYSAIMSFLKKSIQPKYSVEAMDKNVITVGEFTFYSKLVSGSLYRWKSKLSFIYKES